MSNRRSIKAKHRRPSAAVRHGQRAVVVTVAGGMAAGGFVAAAGSAVADHTIVSQAEGYFLSGNVASATLNDLLPTAEAVNKSHNTGSVVLSPQNGQLLGSSTLAALPALPLPGVGVNLLGTGGILDVGALGQYARANGNGSSHGASGAVTSEGAIATGTPTNASVNLTPLLSGVLGTVADLDLEIGALAATATQTAGGAQVGAYKIADVDINLTSPALAGILGTLETAFGTAGSAANLGLLETALGLLSAGGTVTGLPSDTDLDSLLDTVGATDLVGQGFTADLQTGEIRINVDQLIDLNNLPPNTDILPLIVSALNTRLSSALETRLTTLTTGVNAAFNNVGVTPVAPLPAVDPALISGLVSPVVASLLAPVTSAVDGQNALLANSGPLDDVLDGILDLVANVQITAGGVFTERALAIGLSLPALGAFNANAVAQGSLAVVNLASAAVGPNAGPLLAAFPPPFISNPEDGDTTTDRTPLIEGTGVPGAKVTVKEGSNTICTATVAANGKWKCTSERLSLGKHEIVATQKLGDRTSGKSNEVDFRILAADYDDDTRLPATGGNGSTPLVAAAGLGLLLTGMGLTALPGARHGGATANGGGNRARGGRHAKR